MSPTFGASQDVNFAAIFAGGDIRPFLVGQDTRSGGMSRLTLHVASSEGRFALQRKAKAAFARAGMDHKVRVVRYRARDLDKARSLEQFVEPIGSDAIAFDPTGAIGRAARLVRFAHAARSALEDRVCGIYWNSRWRSVYLVLEHKHYVSDGKIAVSDLAETEEAVLSALKAEWGESDDGLVPSLRLGFEMPDISLVPVDRSSYFARRSLLAWFRARTYVPVFGAMLGLGAAGAASAADLPQPENTTVIPYNPESGPAVSEPNGKLSAFGGVRDQNNTSSDGLGGLTGSYSIPLGHQYGAQFDGLLGLRDGDFLGGAGVHLFWRDPSQGLLGITGSYVGWDADNNRGGYTDMFRIGGEGELYLDQFTLAGQAGVQFGDNTDDGFYGRADLKWYATPDLALKLGAEYNEQVEGLGRLGFEFQPGYAGIPGLTLFADAAAGDNDYYKIFGGLRIYFGSPKSLMDRHRRDDPENPLADNGSLIGQGNASPPAVASPPTSPAPYAT